MDSPKTFFHSKNSDRCFIKSLEIKIFRILLPLPVTRILGSLILRYKLSTVRLAISDTLKPAPNAKSIAIQNLGHVVRPFCMSSNALSRINLRNKAIKIDVKIAVEIMEDKLNFLREMNQLKDSLPILSKSSSQQVKINNFTKWVCWNG